MNNETNNPDAQWTTEDDQGRKVSVKVYIPKKPKEDKDK